MAVTIVRPGAIDSTAGAKIAPSPSDNKSTSTPQAAPALKVASAEAVVASLRSQVDRSTRTERLATYEKAREITHEVAERIRADEAAPDAHDDLSPRSAQVILVHGRGER